MAPQRTAMAPQRTKVACRRRSDDSDNYSDGSDYSDDVPSSDEDQVFRVEAVEADDAGSETSQVEETLGTTKKSFCLGELWILCALFLLLLVPAGPRPQSVLSSSSALETSAFCWPEPLTAVPTRLWYNSRWNLVRPGSGWLFATKSSSLAFSFGIEPSRRPPSLTSSEMISKLDDIHPGEQELPLPLKASIKGVFIFRRAIKTLGELPGLEVPTIPYNLRYNAANAFDKSSTFASCPRMRSAKLKKADGGKKKKTFDVEKMADGLVKLSEEDLLQVIQMIHDNKDDAVKASVIS
ncbi:hypothetical protein B0T24DRAFT_711967 [Lasiosphaeria ovina]|uniref:Uncharacterized protein n=1 Tax=Lasiosphaeria ovina TaxID=92902 RepID=A0AAE0JVH5_9PEZI|nr:hypothetical protein B0T24DRAFT_711967 [Lasiosphaeria ovina]